MVVKHCVYPHSKSIVFIIIQKALCLSFNKHCVYCPSKAMCLSSFKKHCFCPRGVYPFLEFSVMLIIFVSNLILHDENYHRDILKCIRCTVFLVRIERGLVL